ncbi:MAG: hypothetical protein KGM17_03030 [Sphingomonadales bacterium]|nr:hypothetical protein [Sphingomonadales bacterium]
MARCDPAVIADPEIRATPAHAAIAPEGCGAWNGEILIMDCINLTCPDGKTPGRVWEIALPIRGRLRDVPVFRQVRAGIGAAYCPIATN